MEFKSLKNGTIANGVGVKRLKSICSDFELVVAKEYHIEALTC